MSKNPKAKQVEDVVESSEDESIVADDIDVESIREDDEEASEYGEGEEEEHEGDVFDLKEDEDIEEDVQYYQDITDIKSSNTYPYLTKFEMARILGVRSQQIGCGAPPCVKASDFPDNKYPQSSIDIVLMELKRGVCPYLIRRPLPNGTNLIIKVSELLISDR